MATDDQHRHIGPPPEHLRGVPGGYCTNPLPHDGPHPFDARDGLPPGPWSCLGVAPAPNPATCEHPDFTAYVEVGRLLAAEGDEQPSGFSADVRVACALCGEPFVFFGAGLPIGLLRDRPAISVDGTELRCPVRPQSADPHHGLGLAGFSARVREGQQQTLN